MDEDWESQGAGLDYAQEVRWSRILGEWSKMIGYQMGSSPVGVCTMAKTSSMKNFKHERNNDMDVNMATLFAKGVLRRLSFLGNLKPLDKKLDLWGTQTWGILLFFFYLLCHTKYCLK